MATGIARLASGTIGRNAIQSVNETAIGQIYTHTETDIKAVIKNLNSKQLANELIASCIVRRLQLPTPRSFLVFSDPADSFGGTRLRHESGLDIYFGSELSNDKSFFAFFNGDSAVALQVLSNSTGWGAILAVDEWIANIDRHFNNFLYNGSEITLFDHDRCFTGPEWTPSDLVANAVYDCHPAVDEIHKSMPIRIRQAAKNIAEQISKVASTVDISAAFKESYAEEAGSGILHDLPAAETFVRDRVHHISALCESRLSIGGLL